MKNIAGLMKQAQQMQSKMQEMQSKLEAMELEGEAGAGLVKVTLNGKGDMRRIKIDPKLVDPERCGDAGGPDRRRPRQRAPKARGRDDGRDAEGHRRHAIAARDEAALLVPFNCPPTSLSLTARLRRHTVIAVPPWQLTSRARSHSPPPHRHRATASPSWPGLTRPSTPH